MSRGTRSEVAGSRQARSGVGIFVLALAAVALVPLLAPPVLGEPDPAVVDSTTPDSIVLVAKVDSIIHPVISEFLLETFAEADRIGANAVVLELNTPGGLLTSTATGTTLTINAATTLTNDGTLSTGFTFVDFATNERELVPDVNFTSNITLVRLVQ